MYYRAAMSNSQPTRREHRGTRTTRTEADCAHCYGKALTISQLDATVAELRARIANLEESA